MNKVILFIFFCVISTTTIAQADALKLKADQGDVDAQYEIYNRYVNGYSISQDMAFSYLNLAAGNGHPEALYRLGLFYIQGKFGFPIWKEKAQDCFFRASEQGHVMAKMELEDLTKEYKPFRKRIRRLVYDQTISIAPSSQTIHYINGKSKLMKQ